MPIPVIAITNASTCLPDAQVEAVIPALQKQVSEDFNRQRRKLIRPAWRNSLR